MDVFAAAPQTPPAFSAAELAGARRHRARLFKVAPAVDHYAALGEKLLAEQDRKDAARLHRIEGLDFEIAGLQAADALGR